MEPLPPTSVVEKNITDAELVGEAIRRAVAKSGTKTRNAACAVAGSAVITKIINMPGNLSEDDMESQIQIEADQYIPYPLEEISLDFQVLGPSEIEPDKVEVMLAASRSDNVDIRVAALGVGGLIAKVVDVEAFALENAMQRLATATNASPMRTSSRHGCRCDHVDAQRSRIPRSSTRASSPSAGDN